MAKIRPLVPELAEVARKELNENETRIPNDIETFRIWIQQQSHLTTRVDDQYLVGFLRFCKYNMEDAKKRIEYYYNYKSSPELLKSRRIDQKITDIAKAGIFATLPSPIGPAGPRIHVTRMGKIDTNLFSIQDIFRFQMFRSEIEINTDDNWIISGVMEIIDCSKIPFAFLKQFEPSSFKKMAAFLEYGVPTNLKGTHIVNASKEVQIILSIVRTLMKQKELLSIHTNLESLQTAIGKQYLPEEYGGTNGTFTEAVENYEKNLLSFHEYFDEDENYFVNEKLRNTMKETSQPVNSDVGSFRKLNFD